MIKPLSPLTRYKVLVKDLPFKASSPRSAPLLSLAAGARLHPTGLHIPADLEFDGWAAIAGNLAQLGSGIQWALGDWWAYGDHKYGVRKAMAAATKLPYEFGTLMNFASIARSVETSRRREALSFSHHAEVMSLEPADQTKMLDRAVERKWSVADLRRALRDKQQNCKSKELDPETQAAGLEGHLAEEAERSRRVDPWFSNWNEEPLLDYLSADTIRKLIEEAGFVADVWTHVKGGLEKYLQERLVQGDSFSPRKIASGWLRMSPNVYNEAGEFVRKLTEAEMAEIEANGRFRPARYRHA